MLSLVQAWVGLICGRKQNWTMTAGQRGLKLTGQSFDFSAFCL